MSLVCVSFSSSIKKNLWSGCPFIVCYLCPRFDPDFICNASDNSGRYTYQAQPAICRWNLARLGEALAPDLPPERAVAVLEEYLPLYNNFYMEIMKRKLGLLRKEEPEDEMLVTDLLQTMQNTGRRITWVTSIGGKLESICGPFVLKLLSCAVGVIM